MKFSALILSFIVLVLSCLPCRDYMVIKPGKNKIEFAKSSDGHKDTHNTDSCSPFCSCSCCAGINFSMTVSVIEKVDFNNPKVDFFYLSSSLRKVALSIFQPPKLAA